VTDSEGYQLTFAYDALDRLTRVTYPDGTFERLRYNRLNPVQFTDRQKRTTRVRYDALRRPVSITDPLDRITQLRWCDCGSLAQLIDAAGNVTTWEHDLQGRVIAKALADGATTRYVYAPASGRLQRMIDPKGQITTYTYTTDDNIRRIAFKNADVDTAPITFTYDPDYDRLIRVKDGIGTTHYAYHPVGERGALQVASITGQLPGSQVDYAYDELGRVVRRSINGVPTVVTYDALGRASRLRNALGTFRLIYVGATERVQSIAYPNGQETVLSYFGVLGDQRLRRLRHQRPDGRVLSQFDYTYETTGEIHTQRRYQPGLEPARTTYTYQYDAARQLLAAVLEDRTDATVKTYAYDYDAAGNRIGEDVGASHRSASFNTVNQLVSLQRGKKTWDFTYDANGNLLSDGVRTFEWDARDRLTAIVSGNRRSEFSYDGFDRRVRIVEERKGAVVSDVWLLWCGTAICAQRIVDTGTSALQKRFFSFGETDDERVYFYTRDYLGSIRQMTDTAGAVVTSYDYDPYGRTIASNGEATASFGYANYYVHAPSQLYLTQYRAYDPTQGRWLSRDPVVEDRGTNLYRFVHNDPINLIDLQGLSPDTVQGYAVDQVKDYVIDKNIKSVQQKNPGVGKRLEQVKRLQDPLKEPRDYAIDRTLTRGRAQVTKCMPELVRKADEAKGAIGKTIDKAIQDFKNDPSTMPLLHKYQEMEDLLKEPGRQFADYLNRLGVR
jgi:RHS repeat-associated protein